MTRKLAIVLFLLVLTPSLATAAGPGLRVRVDVGKSLAAELRARVTDDDKLVIGCSVQIADSPEHSGELTVNYGRAFRRVRREFRDRLAPSKGSTTSAPAQTVRPSWPQPPSLLSGIGFRPAAQGRIESWAGPLYYTLSYEERDRLRDPGWNHLSEPQELERAIAREWELVGQFVETMDLSLRAGHLKDGTLHVFAVWGRTLREPARLQAATKDIGKDYEYLSGYYTASGLRIDDSTITITPVGDRASIMVLGHELAHHAFALFGLKKAWRGDSESFAEAFERWAY
jgi:hypothetical protein